MDRKSQTESQREKKKLCTFVWKYGADETKTEREANKLVKIYDYVMTFVDQSL